jgi:hypothetical protein
MQDFAVNLSVELLDSQFHLLNQGTAMENLQYSVSSSFKRWDPMLSSTGDFVQLAEGVGALDPSLQSDTVFPTSYSPTSEQDNQYPTFQSPTTSEALLDKSNAQKLQLPKPTIRKKQSTPRTTNCRSPRRSRTKTEKKEYRK